MFFRRKPKAVTEENPWLKIDHPHNWLPANDGKELVCGDCGLRKDVQTDRSQLDRLEYSGLFDTIKAGNTIWHESQ